MSIFKLNYDKPGKGVDKDAPEKNIILTYLGLFKRNIMNLIKLNLMFAAASIPMLILLFFLFTWLIYPHLAPVIHELASAVTDVDAGQAQATYMGIFAGVFIVEMLLMFGSGPASASFAYISRTITREEHVWPWSDFAAKFKENFKQSFIVSSINTLAAFLMFNAALFYYFRYSDTQNIMYSILFCIVVFVFVLLVLINGYVYQMIVTFENKLLSLYKNSLLLALAKLPQNLLLNAVPLVLTFFLFTRLTPASISILGVLFWISAMRFPMEFYASRTLMKLIVAKEEQEAEKGTEE